MSFPRLMASGLATLRPGRFISRRVVIGKIEEELRG
jgi:hypothetical protein